MADTSIWRFHKIGGTPKSSVSIGFSIITHPFWVLPLMETPIFMYPEDLCMEYLPTLTPKVISNHPNVGEYSSTMDPMGIFTD